MDPSFVRVAPDSTGKFIRNRYRYELIDLNDGNGPLPILVQSQVVELTDPDGEPVDLDVGVFSQLLMTTRELLRVTRQLHIIAAHDDPRTMRATVQLPTPVGPFLAADAISDRFGRQIVLPCAVRDLVDKQTTTISASTAETTIVTARGGELHDLVLLIVSNTSAATSTRIDFRDTTGGTILFSLQSVGGAAPVGFGVGVPVPQTTHSTHWTAQCATSTTDIRIFALFVRNRPSA